MSTEDDMDVDLRRQNSLEFYVIDGDTNATFATRFCDAVDATYTKLYIFNSFSLKMILPSCTAANASLDADTFVGHSLIIENFAHIPIKTSTFGCTGCVFMPPAASTSPSGATPSSTPTASPFTGFDANSGSIDWDAFFAYFPYLSYLNFRNLISINPTLPLQLGSNIRSFLMPNSQLTGSFAPSFFNFVAGLPPAARIEIDLTNNLLSGSIPPSLFSPFATAEQFSGLIFNFQLNGVSGSIPPGLFDPLTTQEFGDFEWSSGYNDLTGTLPNNLFPLGVSAGRFIFDITSNTISGTIPTDLFANLQGTGFYFAFKASGNKLVGPLPNTLFRSGWHPGISFGIELQSNLLSGTIPPNLLLHGLYANRSFESIWVYLSHNNLEGSIPEELFFDYPQAKKRAFEAESSNSDAALSAASDPVGITATNSFYLDLEYNNFSGTVPSNLLLYSLNSGGAQTPICGLLLGNNRLSSPFPSEVLLAVPATAEFTLQINDNLFTDLPSDCPSASWTLYAFNNLINSTIPESWVNCNLKTLDLSSNRALHGSIPSSLFNDTAITHFDASNTSLSGNLPSFGSQSLTLSLAHTHISFCSTSSTTSVADLVGICNVDYTTACACAASYTCSTSNILGCPVQNPTTSPTTPTNAPSSCRPGTRPASNFVCIDGQWRSVGAVTTPVLVVPAGAGTIVITSASNLTAVIISDIGSKVILEACASNLTQVEVELTKEQMDRLGKKAITQTLITSSDNTSLCNNLRSIKLKARSTSGCKKLKSQSSISPDGLTLSGVFTISTSSCNTWWIVLASVLGGLVVLAVIITIIVVVSCPKLRMKARPYAGSDARAKF